METSQVSPVRRALRWILILSLPAIGVLAVAAVLVRPVGAVRMNTLLTFVGLAVGTALAEVHVRSVRRSPRWVIAAAVAIVISQTSYFLWVWTEWATEPLLYRVWWISMVPAVTSTHLLLLRAASTGKSYLVERATKACVLVLSPLLVALAFYRQVPPEPLPVHVWISLLLAGGSLVGSLLTWRRWSASHSRPVTATRRTGLAWLCLSHIALLVLGLYIGRALAPQPSLFANLPSALSGLSDETIDTQVRSDLRRLRTLAARIDDLAQRSETLDADLRRKFAAEGRDYYLPGEEDDVRWQFMSYLSLRTALLRIVATYSGFETVRDPELKARCFTVGYAAAMTMFRASLKLVATYEQEPIARGKLNEAEPEWGIPTGMFDRILESVTNERNAELAAELGAYFQQKRDAWRETNVWPAEDFEWLDAVIAGGREYVIENRIDRGGAWFDRLVDRVAKDAYTPTYAAQSMVAGWIGDTRIIEKKSLIDAAQIDEIASELEPGDILLERRNWCLSNAFLPGFWPHAALYVGRIDDLRELGIADDDTVMGHLDEYMRPAPDGREHTVIEAVSEGVIFNSLTDSMHADYVAVLRPRVPKNEIARAIVRAFRHKGKPYDFEFDFSTSDKLVCTELVYRAYDGILNFQPIRIVGRPTLPALEIVRKFARERDRPDRELDFVLFLDADRSAGCARRASVEEFCRSADRPRAFNE